LLHRDYVLAADLADFQKKITVNVKSITPEKLPVFLDDLLLTQGIKSVLRGEVYYLSLAGAAEKNDAIVALMVDADLPKSRGDGQKNDINDIEKKDENPDLVVRVFAPQNRPAEFLVAACNAAFRQSVASVSGAVLVVSGKDDKYIDSILELLSLLDLAPATVEVSASFVEISTSGGSSSGLSLVASVLAARTPGLAVSMLPSSGSITVASGRYQMVLDALQSDGRFKQVSNSRVTGDSSEKMTLSVGDETPTISTTGRDNQGNVLQSVVYRPSGVILDVLPRVLGAGGLSLVVDGQVSSFQTTQTGVSGSPTLIKRQVKTSVSLDDGQVLIIGGLDDSKASSGEAGFSFLPKSWKTSKSSNSHTDLVLILSARVLKKL
jgi:general secretion pathway protein D